MWLVIATTEFGQWLLEQDATAREEIAFVLALLAERGPRLGRPYADTLNGSKYPNMKELRVTGKRLAIRIAFVFDPKRNAVLLVAADKRGMSERLFYRKLIARADAQYAEYLKGEI